MRRSLHQALADSSGELDPAEGRLTIRRWYRVAERLPAGVAMRSMHGLTTRRFVEAVLWVAVTDSTWPELPDCYGNHQAVYQRFTRWAKLHIWTVVSLQLEGDARAEALDRLVRQHETIVARRAQGAAASVGAVSEVTASPPVQKRPRGGVPFHLRAIKVEDVGLLLGLTVHEVMDLSCKIDFPRPVAVEPIAWVAGEILAWRDMHRPQV